jgi:hypothetical protein
VEANYLYLLNLAVFCSLHSQPLTPSSARALCGKAPSKACGTTIEGENKWKTLIQNATSAKGKFGEIFSHYIFC